MDAMLDKAMLSTNYADLPALRAKENDAALREKTDQFEALIIKMMLDNALKDEKNLFNSENDPGERIYKSMYRDELARAGAGGFGFSQMLFEHLAQNRANE